MFDSTLSKMFVAISLGASIHFNGGTLKLRKLDPARGLPGQPSRVREEGQDGLQRGDRQALGHGEVHDTIRLVPGTATPMH